MRVPWTKLYVDDRERQALLDTFDSGWLSMGPKVREFEELLAAYVGVRFAIAVNSGTAALDLALKLVGVRPGDEVLVPAFTYIATANAVRYQEARPVFVDIDPRTFTIDPAGARSKLSPRTRAIIAVDYAGQGAHYEQLAALSRETGVALVEDGAPGLGGRQRGKQLCSFGRVSITSFHAAKIFSTIEGGMLFTDEPDLAALARILRSQGEDPQRKYFHPVVGANYRMTDLNAALGLVQMSRADQVLAHRAEAARYYIERLQDCSRLVLPWVEPGNVHAWFLFPVLVEERDRVRSVLSERGVETNVSWPMPVYRQESYKLFAAAACPAAEDTARRVLCLPMFFGITREEQDYVVQQLLSAVEEQAR